MSVAQIEGMFRRISCRYRGFIFGAVIGESLQGPYIDIIPEMKKILEMNNSTSKQIEIYPGNNRVVGAWSTAVCQCLAGFSATIHIKKNCDKGRKLFDETFLASSFANALNSLESKVGTQPKPMNCTPNLILLHAVPVITLSRYGMDLSQLITIVFRFVDIHHYRPIDIFPAIELIMLLKSILGNHNTIPDVYSELQAFMKKSRLNFLYRFHEYEEYRRLPSTEIKPDSGLWMLKNVNDILGITPGGRWSDLPEFLPGLLKVKSESRYPDTAGAVAGLILGGYSGYAGSRFRGSSVRNGGYDNLPEELIRKLWKAQIVEDLADKVAMEFMVGTMDIGERRLRPRKEPKKPESPQNDNGRPVLIYQASDYLLCDFFTLIVKNAFLQEKYSGGVHGYASKYGARTNSHISVICAMCGGDLDEVQQDLIAHGISEDDYTFIDARAPLMQKVFFEPKGMSGYTDKAKKEWLDEYLNRGIVDWLHIREIKDTCYVKYVADGSDNKVASCLVNDGDKNI